MKVTDENDTMIMRSNKMLEPGIESLTEKKKFKIQFAIFARENKLK